MWRTTVATLSIIAVALLSLSLPGIVVGGRGVAFAGEKLSYPGLSFELRGELNEYNGCIGTPCTVPPGTGILVHNASKKWPSITKPGQENWHKRIFLFRYSGRSGEKGLAIERSLSMVGVSEGYPTVEEGKPVKVYDLIMTPGEVLPLARSFYPPCAKAEDQDIKVRLIGFQGNSLTCEILLPECMK